VSARDDILARIRNVEGDDRRVVERRYRPSGAAPVEIDRFIDRLVDYKAAVYRCSVDGIAAVIGTCLSGARSVVRPAGIDPAWTGGLTVRDDNPRLSTLELDQIDAVVTTCALAVAETGTIILDHAAGQGRRALTLVPDHHLVVVRTDQLVASVPDAVAALPPGAVQTWVSGPSATSDIELNRVEGVHGPRRLDVVLVDP
jgi:L-lactate dehydrogenase complex protein LldG